MLRLSITTRWIRENAVCRSFGEAALRLSIAHVTLGRTDSEYRKPGVTTTSGFLFGSVAEMV